MDGRILSSLIFSIYIYERNYKIMSKSILSNFYQLCFFIRFTLLFTGKKGASSYRKLYFFDCISESVERKPITLSKQPVSPSSGSFMTYFVLAIVIVVVGYLVYHNKQKVSEI